MAGPALLRELEAVAGRNVADATAIGGGSINRAARVRFEDGEVVFVKWREGGEPAEFEAEAAGLEWLADGGGRVPGVVAIGEETGWLALEWIEPGYLDAAGEEQLGRDLAALHRSGAPHHGALPPGSPAAEVGVGSLRLATSPSDDWNSFYRDQRLLPLLRMARDQQVIDERGARLVEEVCARIDELTGPSEPPSRLHGDLWSGNVHADEDGRAWLIDPTAYGGHREMDLAMLKLFGGPSQRTYDAYHEAASLAPGFTSRIPLWQLQPLLTHAVLFGGHYGQATARAAQEALSPLG